MHYAIALMENWVKIDVGKMNDCDPILHKGYSVVQKLEPGLLHAQKAVGRADHLVFIYPNWWGSMPALLKGFFDRVFSPEFAFRFDRAKGKAVGLLKGKSARIIILMRQDPALYRVNYPYTGETVKHSILEFCGVRPVRMTEIGPSERLPEAKITRLSKKLEALGRKGV